MKRHVQSPGIRKWSGNDLLDLQDQTLSVLDAFYSQFGNGVISGCKIDGLNISPGWVVVNGMILKFEGATVETLPVYLIRHEESLEREYADNNVKPIAIIYTAVISYQPSENSLKLAPSEKNTFFDLFQNDARLCLTRTLLEKLEGIESLANKYVHPDNANTRHVSDAEKIEWNSKAPSSHSHDYVATGDPLFTRLSGCNNVNTLKGLPVNKKTINATLSAASEISLLSPMSIGADITIFITATASFSLPLPNSGQWISMDGDSIDLSEGDILEMNIYCYSNGYYSVSIKKR